MEHRRSENLKQPHNDRIGPYVKGQSSNNSAHVKTNCTTHVQDGNKLALLLLMATSPCATTRRRTLTHTHTSVPNRILGSVSQQALLILFGGTWRGGICEEPEKKTRLILMSMDFIDKLKDEDNILSHVGRL